MGIAQWYFCSGGRRARRYDWCRDQHIRTIEAYLDVRLFERLPSGAKPTREVRLVASRLTKSFTEIEQILEELGSRRTDQRIVVTMSHFILEHWLSARLPRFHSNAPNVDIQFHTDESYADLFDGSMDFAIRFSPEPSPEYSCDPLHRGWFFPVCTPEFADRYGLHSKTKDLSGVPLFRLFDPTSDPAWVGWNVLISDHRLTKNDPGPVERTAGQGIALAGEGLMISGLTESFSHLKDGRLVAPLGPDFVRPFSYGYRLVWPAGKRLSRTQSLFRGWIKHEMQAYLEEASRLLNKQLD